MENAGNKFWRVIFITAKKKRIDTIEPLIREMC